MVMFHVVKLRYSPATIGITMKTLNSARFGPIIRKAERPSRREVRRRLGSTEAAGMLFAVDGSDTGRRYLMVRRSCGFENHYQVAGG